MSLNALYCNLLSVRQNKVVLYASTERYGDNMRYVAEELLRRGECKVVWVSEKKKVCTPKGIRSVCGRYAMRRELSTAHVIISDARLDKYWEKGFVKKPGQVYIQARYAGLGLVKSGTDVHNINAQVLDKITRDSRQLDFLVSNSRYGTELYRGNGRFGGEILEIGTPRNDVLLSSDRPRAIRAVREKYGISAGQKIALYAPAHRPWTKARFSRPDYGKVLAALQKRFGGDWVLLIRRDPHLNERGMHWLLPKDIPDVMDAWDYPDTTELLIASDVMIGDYSSCTFDFLFTGRPTFFYIPDAEEYERRVGFYESLVNLPSHISHDNKELIANIIRFNEVSFSTLVKQFFQKRGAATSCEKGTALKNLCNLVCKKTATPSLPRINRKQVIVNASAKAWRLIYRKDNVNFDFCRKRFLGMRWLALRKPVLPPHPYGTLPIQENKIFIWATLPKYSDNPKYIVEEIIRRSLPYQIVWCFPPNDRSSFKTPKIFPPHIQFVFYNSEDAWKELSSSKVWICTADRRGFFMRGLRKRAGQFYLQMWHGSFGIKKNSLDPVQYAWSKLSEKEVDYLIANSNFEAEKIFSPLFCFNKQTTSRTYLWGHPRNDIFFDHRQIEARLKVRNVLGIREEKKVVLYAPTWRDDWNLGWNTIDSKSLCTALGERFGGEWICMIRLHFVMHALRRQMMERDHAVIDVYDYPDMQELLATADVFISDYSSCICDFMLTRRPIFLYAPDHIRYSERTRGLLYPLEETPCPIAEDNDELNRNIRQFDEGKYVNELEKFLAKMGCVEDGHAAERVVDLIEEIAPVERNEI